MSLTSNSTSISQLKELANDILVEARNQGCDAAEVTASNDIGFSITVRKGDVETLEHQRDSGVTITVYRGKAKGSASTTDCQPKALKEAVKAASDIARFAQADDCAGLADPAMLAKHIPDCQLFHEWDIDVAAAIDLALACEQTALAQDKRLSSEGCSLQHAYDYFVYANSHGFMGGYPCSNYSLSCELIAKDNGQMQRDYSYTVARDPKALRDSGQLAKEAAERTIKRLKPQRIATANLPVIFEASVARGLLGHFLAAISGGNLYRHSSFLLDQLNQSVFPKYVEMIEKPHLPKAMASAPFDSEGVATQQRDIIKAGILQSYLLSSYSARKLGLQTTGHADGIHNLIVKNNYKTLTDLIKTMDKGLLVTELMGSGVNMVTGDYSRGAVGFWIERGEIQYPVEEITIAGNLKDMYSRMVGIAGDTDTRGRVHTGSILLENMMVAG